MSESLVSNRIKFHKKGIQKDFILKAEKLSGLTARKLSHKLKISDRTLKDWTSERINMSYVAAQSISKLANIPIPKKHSIIDWKLHMQKAGRIGGKNKFLKYGNISGDEIYRKIKWREWWNSTGQYNKPSKNFQSLINIKIPTKSQKLAEFVGIMLGDGGISNYSVTVTLSSTEVKYARYVSKLIYELFGILPKVYRRKGQNAVDIVMQRKRLVDFCQSAGLVLGNKVEQQIDIPKWIKQSREFSIACIRGLVDTDGCFFPHNYIVGGQRYSYLKIAFTNASRPLVLSVAEILTELGIKARISKNYKDVRVENSEYVLRYIQKIGSHNKKHLKKIKMKKN